MDERIYSLDIAGKNVTAQFTSLAEQAGGSVIMSCDETVVLATACISRDGKNNPGFFNLTVEYVERYYAAGKIMGGQWNKREGRPSDQAILAARMIDRTMRPLFPSYIKNAIQVIVTVLAVGKMDPKILAVNAASLAIGVSPIPFAGPVGAVSITVPTGGTEMLVNNYLPTVTEPTNDLDLVVCGKGGKICMIESMAFEYDNEKMGQAIDLADTNIAIFEKWQKEIITKEGKEKKVFEEPTIPEDLKAIFNQTFLPRLKTEIYGKDSKNAALAIEDEWHKVVNEQYPDDKDVYSVAFDYMHDALDQAFHDGAILDGKRADLRRFDEVRSIFAKAGGISPVLHGSGIFYRGETHVLSVLTLDGPETRQGVEGIEAKGKKRFMHHYNFPPYSVGETGRIGGLNRREMGHGFLAEKALVPVIPNYETFPYTIRVVSESTASNGSTSQASICAASIALMDGGVPIKSPVAGVAMGLMQDSKDESKYKILTDIQGPEDHYGDMDFKVAGTEKGVTAIQLDIKLEGVSPKILKEALVEAEKARKHILEIVKKELPQAREEMSLRAPRIAITKVNPDQIGMVIGPGGKTINSIRDLTGTEITIEEDGKVLISGNKEGADKAKTIIEDMTRIFVVGDIIKDAEVTRVADFGVFVKLNNSMEALVHISELASFRVEKVADVIKVGDRVPVQIIKVEEGKIAASIKAIDPNLIKKLV